MLEILLNAWNTAIVSPWTKTRREREKGDSCQVSTIYFHNNPNEAVFRWCIWIKWYSGTHFPLNWKRHGHFLSMIALFSFTDHPKSEKQCWSFETEIGKWKGNKSIERLRARTIPWFFGPSEHFQKWPKNQGIVLALSPPIKNPSVCTGRFGL